MSEDNIVQDLRIGDRVKIRNDWLSKEAKQTYARIKKFYNYQPYRNGHIIKMAEVEWFGKNYQKLTIECGVIFPLDEIKKI